MRLGTFWKRFYGCKTAEIDPVKKHFSHVAGSFTLDSVDFDFSPRTAIWQPDKRFLSRLKSAYRHAIARYEQPANTMWALIGERRRPIHDALLGEDDKHLASLLANPAQTELYYGIDTLSVTSVVDLHAPHDGARHHVGRTIVSHLLSLAEAIAARRLWNPETQPARRGIEEIEGLLTDIDRALGCQLQFPNPFPDEFGIRTSRGILAFKVPMAVYQAYRLKSLAARAGGSKILEIGAGMGRTAYYARAMGLRDYSTVDLPMGVVAQACFLAAALGPEEIWLPGESTTNTCGRIRLLTPEDLRDTEERFDVILNADSFTEMSLEQASDYFSYFTRKAKILYSLNHEANTFRVCDLPSTVGFTGASMRHSCSIRPGYVEEYFFQDDDEDRERQASS